MTTRTLESLRWGALMSLVSLVALTGCVGGAEMPQSVRAGDAQQAAGNSTGVGLELVGPTAVVEPTPALDPVVEFPNEPIWLQYWFPIDNVDRDHGPLSGLILDWADARPGMSVADLGAGGGYYSFRLARAVGPEGHVWAVDVDGRMTRKIAWEVHARGVSQITPLRVRRGSLGLTERSLDLAVMIDTGILNTCRPDDNARYLAQIASALSPGGRFLFMDATHDSGNPDIKGGTDGCRTPHTDEVVALAAENFTELRRQDVSTGDSWRGYLVLFERR